MCFENIAIVKYPSNQYNYEWCTFLPFQDTFYGYLPLIAGRNNPNPSRKDDWLVMFTKSDVDDATGRTIIIPLGWYEKATFEQERLPRPEYEVEKKFPLDEDGNRYVYSVTAQKAYEIRIERREEFRFENLQGTLNRNFVYVRNSKIDREYYSSRIIEAVNICLENKKDFLANKRNSW